MKKILVATDFSQASRNAALYGLELADALNAQLIIFTAYQQLPVPVTEAPGVITPNDMRKLVQQQLDMEADMVYSGNRINVETYCREGVPTEAIPRAIEETKADLVIAGMKAGGKGMRRLLGSTITGLVKKTNIPLIVVPEDAKYIPATTIALANESDLEPDTDSRLLAALSTIGEKFHSKLFLVRVAKNKFSELYQVLNHPFTLDRILCNLDPVYKCIEGKNIPQALNEFIDAYHIAMLALLPHKHSLLEKWFIKSTTRSMIFETRIPLLILPDLPAWNTVRRISNRKERVL